MATYPGGTSTFTNKRNLLDDVKAEHINTLQDEVRALQVAVGTMPYLDRTLNGVENNYASVRGRMEATQRGTHLPVIQLQCTTTLSNAYDLDVNYDAPHVVYDTQGMFDGVGFTIARGGWWIITTDVSWQQNGNGERKQLIMSGGTGSAGVEMAGQSIPATNSWSTRTNVSWQGALPVGKKITTRVRHTAGTGVTLSIGVTLSASFVRELPGVQVY